MGFSADWLALREPADQRARDPALARRAAAAAGSEPVIVDLGCGTGATWRALSPQLPTTARWRFVDKDPELLQHACAAAGGSAEAVEADIADVAFLPLAGATMVTASALLDLVSDTWLEELVRRLGVPFYAALSYCGTMRWLPDDPRDATVTAAFNRHQRGEKGLGPALGPESVSRAECLLTGAGFAVFRADSPWHLGPKMAPLQRALTDGIAAAAAAAGVADAAAWGRHRHAMAHRSRCEIGHVDLLALPAARADGVGHVIR